MKGSRETGGSEGGSYSLGKIVDDFLLNVRYNRKDETGIAGGLGYGYF